jgi:cytochrome bd-type quinol oxidase subunit 1
VVITEGVIGHRIQFAFTITDQYLFPRLTMGLTLLIVMFKSLGLMCEDEAPA